MIYYIVWIFQQAGLSESAALTSASIQYALLVVMTVPALLFADKWSRRKTMMIGSFTMAFWLYTEGALMAVYGHAVPGGINGNTTLTWTVDSPKVSKAIIACSYLFVCCFSVTWG